MVSRSLADLRKTVSPRMIRSLDLLIGHDGLTSGRVSMQESHVRVDGHVTVPRKPRYLHYRYGIEYLNASPARHTHPHFPALTTSLSTSRHNFSSIQYSPSLRLCGRTHDYALYQRAAMSRPPSADVSTAHDRTRELSQTQRRPKIRLQ